MSDVAERFFKNKNIPSNIELNPYIIRSAELIQLADEEVNRLVENEITRLQEEAVWSVVHDMYKKCHEFTSGALSIFIMGSVASAEVLCRTAVESSVNLFYVALGNDVENVISYFRTYLETERNQNQSWLKSVNRSNYDEEGKEYHRGLINDKDRALSFYEDGLRKSLALINIDYDSFAGSWPSAFDRFCKIDKEVGYRTVYASLCSQAHNDPEDILNNLMSRIIDVKGIEEYAERERYIFSLFMVATSINYYIESSAIYLSKYNIDVMEAFVPLINSARSLQSELQSRSKEFCSAPMRSSPA